MTITTTPQMVEECVLRVVCMCDYSGSLHYVVDALHTTVGVRSGTDCVTYPGRFALCVYLTV